MGAHTIDDFATQKNDDFHDYGQFKVYLPGVNEATLPKVRGFLASHSRQVAGAHGIGFKLKESGIDSSKEGITYITVEGKKGPIRETVQAAYTQLRIHRPSTTPSYRAP